MRITPGRCPPPDVHRRARRRRRGGPSSAGSGSWKTTRPTARPAAPPAMASRISSRTSARGSAAAAVAASARRGPPRKRTGTPTLATTRATASTRAGPGATSGTGTLSTGAPRSWATTAAKTIESVSRATAPSRHDRGSTSASSPARPGSLEHLAEQLEGGRGQGVGHVDAGHVLDAGPPVGGGLLDRRHQPVVELERAAGQPGAVERQIGAVPGLDGTRRREVAQRLGAGQDAVAELERGGAARRGTAA